MKDRFFLASASPRRAALLRQLGLDFEIIPSTIDEKLNGVKSPLQYVLTISGRKAGEVAARVRRGIIISADTLVVLNDKFLGKPRDKKEAKEMLQQLSGREHLVYTGFTIAHMPSRKMVSDYEVTRVKFRNLSRDEVEAYVKTGSCLDKAGAYGIQDDFGAVFVERIDGCFYNVMGFPLTKFYVTWRKFQEGLKR